MTEPAKPRRGCLFYGCLGAATMVLVVLLAGYLGFRYAINRFTDSKPLPLPKTQLSGQEMDRLRGRIANFSQAIGENKSSARLTLTTDEANALIQTEPGWAFLKDQIYVTFESNQLKAQLSVPADRLGSSRLRGRYLNASGTFNISLQNGALQVSADSLSAKGRPVPETVMRQIRGQNFALIFTNAEVNQALRQLQSVQVKNGEIVIVPK